jgi:hypothetical protein
MSESIFEKGLKVNVKDHVEKKGKFNYLSWAWAVQELRMLDPKASWEVRHFDNYKTKDDIWYTVNHDPFMSTDCGYFVEVIVTLSDGTKSQQIHPVLDNYNKPISKPNCFQINTSTQRCLTKAIALASGIGLYLYAGEDLPPEAEENKPAKKTEPLTIDSMILFINSCKTEKSLADYYKENEDTINGFFKAEKEEVLEAFKFRKQQIKELGGNSNAQRND